MTALVKCVGPDHHQLHFRRPDLRGLQHALERVDEAVGYIGGGGHLHDGAHVALVHHHRVGVGAAHIHADSIHMPTLDRRHHANQQRRIGFS